MNDLYSSLTRLNENNMYDLKTSAEFLFENDDWPNPYLQLNINSNFFDPDSIVEKFSNSTKPLFISLNIQSLQSKYESLRKFVLNLVNKKVQIMAIALQEIWSVQYPDFFIIPGFSFVYKSRDKGRGGGVAFYVNNGKKYGTLH
jgi:hypothetical protein